jgi:hypothetical protein
MWNSLPLPRPRDGVKEVETGHLFVRDLGIDADHLRMIERGDETEVGTGGRHVDVAARLVRLGLEREASPRRSSEHHRDS